MFLFRPVETAGLQTVARLTTCCEPHLHVQMLDLSLQEEKVNNNINNTSQVRGHRSGSSASVTVCTSTPTVSVSYIHRSPPLTSDL